jgi:ribosomal-protein-alanine N-acetyltransferase
MAGPILFASARLDYRRLEAGDVGARYVAWMNDPDVVRYLESRHQQQSESDVRDFVARQAAREDTLFLGMYLRDDGAHIGNVKLSPIVRRHARAELGILIGERAAWGKGYASEAIAAAAAYAFSELKLAKITAGCYGSNRGSRNAFAKAGFSVEGTRPAQYDLDGIWDDEIIMGLLASGRKTGGRVSR